MSDFKCGDDLDGNHPDNEVQVPLILESWTYGNISTLVVRRVPIYRSMHGYSAAIMGITYMSGLHNKTLTLINPYNNFLLILSKWTFRKVSNITDVEKIQDHNKIIKTNIKQYLEIIC